MAFVKLAGPAKIGGKWRRASEIVEVGDDAQAGLDDLGLVESVVTELAAAPGVDLRKVDLASVPAGGKLITISEDDFHLAVAARAEALAGEVMDAAVEGLENQTRRVEELTGELEAERTAHEETRQQLTAERDAALESARVTLNPGPSAEVLRDQVMDAIDAATNDPAPTDTPPEQAAQTAPKKGAAAKTKG